MQEKLKEAFYKARHEENSYLAENIWHNIILRNKRIIRLKLWAFSFVGITSLAGLIPTWHTLSNDLTQSGFYEYISLVFSNSTLILSYWKELTFSIAESLPTTSIVLSFSLIFILLLSIKYVMKQIIINNYIGETYKTA